MSVDKQDDLPRGWVRSRLAALVTHKSGNSKLIKGKQESQPRDGNWPAFSASGQDVWVANWEQEGRAVVVSAVGARCGKAFRADGRWAAVANTHVVRPDERVLDRDFLWYLINNENYWIRSGTAQPFVKVANSFEREQLLPPVSEQRRIVAAIESHFSRLDAATATLERVQRNLERYRASVLKAAVEGRLVPTEAERAKKEGRCYEPASVLLKRILADRRRRWEEAELAKLTAKGKPPIDDRWKAKYEEPAAPDVAGLPKLPEGWSWASVDAVGDVLLGRRRAPEYSGKGRPYLRVANVRDDRIDLAVIKKMPFDDGHFERHRLLPGDILVSEGQSPELIGQSAMFPAGLEDMCFQSTLHRFRAHPQLITPQFAQVVFRSHVKTGVFRRFASITTNIAHLVLNRFKVVPMPVPPLDEQAHIVEAATRLITLAEHCMQDAERQLARIARLRQSILKWAFEGRLTGERRRARQGPTTATTSPP